MIIKVRDVPNGWYITSGVKDVSWRKEVELEEVLKLAVEYANEENKEVENLPDSMIGDRLWADEEAGITEGETYCVIEYIQGTTIRKIITIQDCYLLNDNGQTIERIN
jgi:hypothetical protein